MKKLFELIDRERFVVPSAAAFMTGFSLLTVPHIGEFATGFFNGMMFLLAVLIYDDEGDLL